MHEHGEHCGCGHSHGHHENGEHCGCGHSHGHHEKGEHCGCGHSHGHHEHGEHCGCGHTHVPIPMPEGLTPVQVNFLIALRQRQCLPVACFSYTGDGGKTPHAIALAPVYLGSPEDTMAQVKQLGNELSGLEAMELLTLDYDIPLRGYPYDEYKNSTLYAYFAKTVEEAATRPGASLVAPMLELGSMALTEAGEEMVDRLVHAAAEHG